MTFKRRLAAASVGLAACLFASLPVWGQDALMGPLRIRDMTPFSILRLEMLPADAAPIGARRWSVDAGITQTNTFVMSGNVRSYLERRGGRGALTQNDVAAIQSLGTDAYYVDGEIGLLDLTLHYGLTANTSLYLTVPVYDYSGGFLDGTVEGFHSAFGLDDDSRDLVERDRFQAVASIGGENVAVLDAPVGRGVGDPVVGIRRAWPLGSSSRWRVVTDGAVKVALRGERPFLSTGSHDYGLQASLQGKFRHHGLYLSASAVRLDGALFGVQLGNRVVPTVTAAYELEATPFTNVILQLYGSEGAIRDTPIKDLRANKYQVSLGVRSRRGPLLYGFALTENVANFENTPDLGLSLLLGWISRHY